MTQTVHGTIANLDPNAVCEEPTCQQYGELMRNHQVVHRGKGAPRNQKGLCPDCGMQVHNSHDRDLTITMNCLWQQTYGDKSLKTPVTAANLEKVVTGMKKGDITSWASLAKIKSLVNGVVHPAPKTTSATPAATTPVATAPTAPPTSGATTAGPVAITAIPAPTRTAPVAPARGGKIDAETAKRLSNIFKGAGLRPS